MNSNNLPIALLAFFLGALGLYIYSQGQPELGIGILLVTLIATLIVTRMNNNKPQPKKKSKKRRR